MGCQNVSVLVLISVVADIFISYKRDERQAVERLANEFQRLGLQVWFDAGLNAGEAFSDEIDREAHSAKAIVVCWSPSAKESQWVKAEALIGFEQSKLAACYVAGPDGFYPPTPFNAVHAEDLRTWLVAPSSTHSGWKGMLRRVGKLCERADLESYGALDAYATPTVLRDWLNKHSDSPLFLAAEESLRERNAEAAEVARLEQAARDRRSQEEAAWRADQARRPDVPPDNTGSIYEAKRQQLESQKEAAQSEALSELRWAMDAAQSVSKLTADLRDLFPRWCVEFKPLNKDAAYDYPLLLSAAPPNPSDTEVRAAYAANEWDHDFVEAGHFIEQSQVVFACGDFEGAAFFKKESRHLFQTVVSLDWKRELNCELFDETAIEVSDFQPVSFEKFVTDSGVASTYSERLRLLHAWVSERYAEFCAVRGVSPTQYEMEAEVVRKGEAQREAAARRGQPPQQRSTISGVLNYSKATVLALFFVFAFMVAFALVAQWLGWQ